MKRILAIIFICACMAAVFAMAKIPTLIPFRGQSNYLHLIMLCSERSLPARLSPSAAAWPQHTTHQR